MLFSLFSCTFLDLRASALSYPKLLWSLGISFLLTTLVLSFLSSLLRLALIIQGTSAEQDGRFSDKDKKLLKSLKFDPIFDIKVVIFVSLFFSASPLWLPFLMCSRWIKRK